MRAYAAWLFGAAAAFNAVVGLILLLARGLIVPALDLAPIAGTNIAFVDLVGALVLLFAYVYVRIARDPVGWRPVIHVMAIGKLIAFACACAPWLTGDAGPKLPMLAAGDVLLAALFFDYLRRTRGAG